MYARPARNRFCIIVLMLASISGCQSPGAPSGFRLPWFKTARLGNAPALLETDDAQPLQPAQKADIQVALARTLERQGRIDEAKKVYLEAIKTNPERADAHHLMGLLHARNGDCQTAEQYYQKANQLDPENAELYCDLGYCFYLQQRWDEAESNLRRAVALAPDSRRARNNLGLLLARTGREQEAFGEFAKAGCSEAEAHTNLAFALSLAERRDVAEAHFQRAVDLDPSLKTAQQGLASLRSLTANAGGGLPAETPLPDASIVSQAAFLAPASGR